MSRQQAKQNSQQKQKTVNKKKDTDPRALYMVLFVLFITFIFFTNTRDSSFFSMNNKSEETNIIKLIKDVKNNEIKNIIVEEEKAYIERNDNKKQFIIREGQESFITTFKNAGGNPLSVPITIKDSSLSRTIREAISVLLPMLIIFGTIFFIIKQAKGTQDSIFSFTNSKAKRFTKDMPKIKFSDIAGVNEAKEEMYEIVDFLKNPQKYKTVGARTPKGAILVGPAGCGKTLLARAVAGEANVPFFSIAGSEFMESFVGVGAARVRDLFSNAKKFSPSIIFIDEIDAIGRSRSSNGMSSHDGEREQTLNQILVEMDGFSPNERVIVIAATNRGDVLDVALTRPGRFDRKIFVDYPDLQGRKEILSIHAKGKPFDKDLNWDRVAGRTVGFSGADLENVLNEAAIYAARESRSNVTFEDIENAAMKVKLGPEKKRLKSDFDKKITAFHEAGHAIVSHFLPNTDPVRRISIVSRGMAGGYTIIHPTKDETYITKTKLFEQICVYLGGRIAEDITLGEITTGASSDIKRATEIAREMVMSYGMSKLGIMDLSQNDKGYFYEQNKHSEEMLKKIDQEVKSILDEAYDATKKLLLEKEKDLRKIGEVLMEKETIDQVDFELIVGKKIER